MSLAGDTTSEAARVQRAVLAAKTGPERVAMALEMSGLVRELLMDGIARRHPEATEDELKWHLVERLYGRSLADKVFPE